MPYDAIDTRRPSVAKPRVAIRWLGSLGLVLASFIVGLMLLEIACRLMLGGLQALIHWPNLVLKSRLEANKAQGPDLGPSYVHNPNLGYVNKPNYQSWALNFDAHGFRFMPPLRAGGVQGPPILATGDSFTKGDEVADAESWPAQVQTILGWRTVNAGVGAYGLDQTVLRTEQLVKALKPAVAAEDVAELGPVHLPPPPSYGGGYRRGKATPTMLEAFRS